LSPKPTLGILGGGQLAQMMAIAAKNLGINCVVYDPSRDACSQNSAQLIVGSYSDPQSLLKFADMVDVVTYEFENVPNESLEVLSSVTTIHPNTQALRVASDRVPEKQFFESHGVAIGPYRPVTGAESLRKACTELGLPAVLKSCSGGYDGKGQFVLHTEDELENALGQIGDVPFIYEAFVPFGRELSVIACRTQTGDTVTYPLTQNTHQHGILVRSEAPAEVDADTQSQALKIAKSIGDGLGYAGVFAVELFDVGGTLLANEMAPRVHNTGHWTIEGARTSQFENHVRAVMGMELGSTDLVGHSVMLNIIGAMPSSADIDQVPNACLHDYAKAPRPGRKIGHITVNSTDTETSRSNAAEAQARLCNTMPGGGVRP
jgi:5-(carboxyamino)imidazole ribonucleotide synthase